MAHGAWTKNDLAALVLHGRGAAQDMVTVFHFEATGAQQLLNTSDAAAQSWADALIDDWRTNHMSAWLAIIPAPYTLPRVTAQVLERNGQTNHKLSLTERTYTSSFTGTYTATAATTDPTTCGIIRWKTPQAGKKHRGRSYVPFPGTTTAGQLVSNAKTVYQTFADGMITSYSGSTPANGSLMTVYSRPYSAPAGAYVKRIGGVLTVVNDTTDYDGDSTNITARQVDDILRVQRRRELGVGS